MYKERVKSVLNYRKPAFWIVLASVIICAVIAVCFLTNPKSERRFPVNAENVSDVEPTPNTETAASETQSDLQISDTMGVIKRDCFTYHGGIG